jgi:hypothetical protein
MCAVCNCSAVLLALHTWDPFPLLWLARLSLRDARRFTAMRCLLLSKRLGPFPFNTLTPVLEPPVDTSCIVLMTPELALKCAAAGQPMSSFLVVLLCCSSVCLFVCLFVCLSVFVSFRLLLAD